MVDRLVEIARYSSSLEAALARNRLETAGIPSYLDGEAMASWFWHLGSAIGGVKLLVSAEDSQRAVRVLSQIELSDTGGDSEFGGPAEEDKTDDVSPEFLFAWRSAIVGVFLLPPLLNIYSTWLIIRHKLLSGPKRNWRIMVAMGVNLCVCSAAAMLLWMMIPSEPEPSSGRIFWQQQVGEDGEIEMIEVEESELPDPPKPVTVRKTLVIPIVPGY